MTRAEHLDWCKKRAIEIAETGDTNGAFASFVSDMSKHPETAGHSALMMGTMLLSTGNLDSVKQMVDHINGYN